MNMTIKEFADMLKSDIELLSNSTIPLKEDYKRGFLAGLDHALRRASLPDIETQTIPPTSSKGLRLRAYICGLDGHNHVEL